MKKLFAGVLLLFIAVSAGAQKNQFAYQSPKQLRKNAIAQTRFDRTPSVLEDFALTDIDPSAINIIRDAYGVPHIFAKTDAEVSYGLAWAHAEDDFATIQKAFLASKGMLGQHNGREGAT